MASIEKIQIKNFKSHKNYSLNINKKFRHIVIYGDNGVGKTNLIETLSHFSNSKGLRGDSIEKIVPLSHSGIADTKVTLNIFSRGSILNLIFLLEQNDNSIKKIFFIDQKKTSLANIKNYISFIWLSPYMDKIMHEGQSVKRNFIDKMISQNDKYFNRILSTYKKDLSERISVLKSSKDEKWLGILEHRIAENIYDILNIRRNYAYELNSIISKKLKNFRDIELNYKNILNLDFENKNISVKIFSEKLKINRQLDEISKRTNFGINSDQIFFFDKKNKIDTDFCSTGEQKSSLLTIILANCWKMKIEKKDFILLLDEAISHIDEENFKKLFNEVDKFDTQIWYTGTSKNLFQVIENKGFFIHLH